MIDWITPIITGLVWIAIFIALFFIITTYQLVFHYGEEKCPFCGKWTRDKGYRKQDCDKCGMTILYADYDY